jgi:hypothetical protein
MATKRRLTRVVPIRVTPRHQDALRRLARQRDANVSIVVRNIIDDYLARNTACPGVAQNSEHAENDVAGRPIDQSVDRSVDRSLGQPIGGDLDQVGAAA